MVLWYFYTPHCRWKVGSRRHPIPDFVEILLRLFSKSSIDLPSTPAAPLLALTLSYASQTIILEISNGFVSLNGSSSIVDRSVKPGNVTPWLYPLSWASSLLRVTPHLCLASVLSLLRFGAKVFSCRNPLPTCFGACFALTRLNCIHQDRRFPHVPRKSLIQIHATSMPYTAWSVNRFSSRLIPRLQPVLGFDVITKLTTLHQWFACAHLFESYMTR